MRFWELDVLDLFTAEGYREGLIFRKINSLPTCGEGRIVKGIHLGSITKFHDSIEVCKVKNEILKWKKLEELK